METDVDGRRQSAEPLTGLLNLIRCVFVRHYTL